MNRQSQAILSCLRRSLNVSTASREQNQSPVDPVDRGGETPPFLAATDETDMLGDQVAPEQSGAKDKGELTNEFAEHSG